MSTRNGRSSVSSTSSKAKRHSTSEDPGKVTAIPPQVPKKRPALSNLTNQRNISQNSARPSVASKTMVPCTARNGKAKKDNTTYTKNSDIPGNSSVSVNLKPSVAVTCIDTSLLKSAGSVSRNSAFTAPLNIYVSPSSSEEHSVSLDDTTSSSDSLKSPEVEYIENDDSSALNSIARKTSSSLYISEPAGNMCKRDILLAMETDKDFVNVDDNFFDPQFCATIACDIYKHLRASETRKRPSIDYMDTVQKDINASMRAILIDWLVEVSEEYRLVPETLYLTVNYIDRYLSGNVMNRQKLQLLGVACMMIASKYEEICAPQVEEFCYITDNTYFKEEVLQMESSVLNYLKFEMTAPTAKCFLRRFVRAAQGTNEVPLLHLECMANYLTELSLLEYNMLSYTPSLIAASAIFLAKYILAPLKRPWTSTLDHYTLYGASDLCDCVKALHRLCCESQNSSLPAIREKYSQHKYKFVAKKYCPASIPAEFFHN